MIHQYTATTLADALMINILSYPVVSTYDECGVSGGVFGISIGRHEVCQDGAKG